MEARDESMRGHFEHWSGLYARVGFVASHSSLVEQCLAELVVRLLDSPQGMLMVQGQSFQQNEQAVRALTSARVPGELTTQLNEVLERARSLMAQRNQVLHGSWLASDGDEQVLRSLVPKRWGKADESTWALDAIYDLGANLQAVAEDLLAVAAGVQVEREGAEAE